MDASQELAGILSDVRSYLELLRDEGARTVEVSRDVLDDLARVRTPAPRAAAPAPQPAHDPATPRSDFWLLAKQR